jgi:type IX secretion system PorP/SprF family membrane protein
MNKRLKLAVSVCVGLITGVDLQAQDIHFSQFYENAILRNPALTGIFSGDYKAGINYRNQWSNISVPFQTVLGSVEARIPINSEVGDYLSVGLTGTYDKAGSISFNSFQAYPAVNYNKAIEDEHQSYLSVGFAAGYVQRSVDPNKMSFSSQYVGGSFNSSNPSGEHINNTKMQYFDLGAGISFNSSLGENNNINYYLGLAAYHLNKPKAAFSNDESFIRLNKKWSGNLGVQYLLNNKVALTTHLNYSRQGTYQEMIGGVLASWRSIDAAGRNLFTIYGGVFYRVKDAIIPTVKLDYQNYSFTLSYDVNTSGLKTATNGMGGMEISVFSRGNFTKGVWAKDKTRCPRFEQLMLPSFQ